MRFKGYSSKGQIQYYIQYFICYKVEPAFLFEVKKRKITDISLFSHLKVQNNENPQSPVPQQLNGSLLSCGFVM